MFLHRPWTWAPPCAALLLMAVVYVTGSNQSLFLMLNRVGHFAGDFWWVNLTILGDGAIALALVLPSIRKSPQRFWAALIAAVIAGLWVQAWKRVVHVPRPLSVFPAEQFFQTGPGLRMGSFPSGHATAIFAIAGIWVMSLSRQYLLRAGLFAVAVLVGLSRIMVGVHWPLDILAGMFGGWLSAYIGLWLANRRGWTTYGAGGYLAAAVLVVVTAALLVSDHIGYPAAIPLQRVIGMVCLVWGAWEIYSMVPHRNKRSSAVED
jgi:membrane-associated phospholipid phosphatase